MLIFSWNCRGLRNDSTVLALKSFLRATNPSIVFLSETKATSTASSFHITTLGFNNYAFVGSSGYKGLSGGLWVLWTDDVCVNIVSKTASRRRLMLILGPCCVFTVRQIPQNIGSFREDIIQFGATHSEPWCCIGDFNAIYDFSEKEGGRPFESTNMDSFREMISTTGLIDLGYAGPAYTWINNQASHSHIRQRLDRVLASPDWCFKFQHTAVNHLPRLGSDQSPILLNTMRILQRYIPSFKFEAH
ncbi:uncharacterized protein LOC113312888 [Papaver somniferum]|uniref:uncharacterized protein LOC113312888 n=1 Tax=Papaver somniferum TaxID=3469 RepID=UPI000E7005AB|nr:uncharacterized protein LOC113312888 [Papaver somniferum]